jgi:hypothetical protein
MAKRETQPSQSKSQSQPRTPSGHFNANGQSQGKQTGAVRSTPDACNDCKKGSK